MLTSRTFGWVLCIDPGLEGTGWAVVQSLPGKQKRPRRPVDSGVLRSQEGEWQERAHVMALKLNSLLLTLYVDRVVIEMPELFGGSEVSHASAARGDLFKLAFLVGEMQHVVYRCTGRLPTLRAPREWKGQMSKNVVLGRIRRALQQPKLTLRDHECDAWGMCLAVQGAL